MIFLIACAILAVAVSGMIFGAIKIVEIIGSVKD